MLADFKYRRCGRLLFDFMLPDHHFILCITVMQKDHVNFGGTILELLYLCFGMQNSFNTLKRRLSKLGIHKEASTAPVLEICECNEANFLVPLRED